MLSANQLSIPLGRIPKGEPRTFSYTLTNNSSTSLRIESIQVGCGACTTASCEQTVLAPHGQTVINVTFTPTSTGAQVKSVTVKATTNSLKLSFSAEVYG